MPNVTGQALLRRASILLQDSAFDRWQEDELLDWANDGQREYVRLRPSAYVRNIDFSLATGAQQQLPADAVSLIEIVRNKDGNPVREMSRRSLDTQIRDWTSASRAKPVVAHYCYTNTNPKVFQVYPPSPGGNVVELAYHAIPADVTLTGTLVVDDSAVPALIDYVMFRALSKDAEFAANSTGAAMHYQAFIAAATGKPPHPATPDA